MGISIPTADVLGSSDLDQGERHPVVLQPHAAAQVGEVLLPRRVVRTQQRDLLRPAQFGAVAAAASSTVTSDDQRGMSSIVVT